MNDTLNRCFKGWCGIVGSLILMLGRPGFALATECAFADQAIRSEVDGRVSMVFGKTRLSLEIARTRPQRERGLMYRKTLARHHGMIFLYDADAEQHFWMKNTYIPLDVIFFTGAGEISRIVPDLSSGASSPEWRLPVTTGEGCVVLELPAGEAAADEITRSKRPYFVRTP